MKKAVVDGGLMVMVEVSLESGEGSVRDVVVESRGMLLLSSISFW